jgi:hypothetical protein
VSTFIGAVLGVVGLGAGGLVAAHFARKSRRLAWQAQFLAARLAPLALRAGLNEEDQDAVEEALAWTTLMQGGDLSPGVIKNLDFCPSHHCYSVATNKIPLAALPNPAQVPGLLNYPPDPPPEDRCPDDCLHIKTHRWRGWAVRQDPQNNALFLFCVSFAQYHCVEPTDAPPPPPIEGPPPPEGGPTA